MRCRSGTRLSVACWLADRREPWLVDATGAATNLAGGIPRVCWLVTVNLVVLAARQMLGVLRA